MVSIGQIIKIKDEDAKRPDAKIANQGRKDDKQQTDQVRKYQVRIPLLHGIQGSADSIPDDQLPFATFCPVPGSEATKLQEKDLVYAASVDFDFSKIVILGLVPDDQAFAVKGGPSLKRVEELQMAENGTASFNSNITISQDNVRVEWKNLKMLAGFSGDLLGDTGKSIGSSLADVVWPLKNGGLGVSINLKDDKKGLETARKTARDNLGIYSTKIISESEFDKIQTNNSYEKNTIYFIYEDEVED